MMGFGSMTIGLGTIAFDGEGEPAAAFIVGAVLLAWGIRTFNAVAAEN